MASTDPSPVGEIVARGREAGLDARSCAAAVGWSLVEQGRLPAAPAVPLFAEASDAARTFAGELASVPPTEPEWLLGQVYESALGSGERRRAGAFFTPPSAARGFVVLALGAWHRPIEDVVVCDPAIGGGAFALAAAEALAASGVARRDVVADRIWGIDIDPDAVEVARAALAIWAGPGGSAEPGDHLRVADGLTGDVSDWRGGGFDLIVGNPPFQNQLGSSTARSDADRAALADRFGPIAKGYTDSAALFLLAGRAMVAPGGRVAMIQPVSTLVAAHAEPIRRALLDQAELRGMWLGGRKVFSASAAVSVCGVVLEANDPAAAGDGAGDGNVVVSRAGGPEVEAAPPLTIDHDDLAGAATWAETVADLRGLPAHEIATAGTLGEWASATAGFRDQFYGLVPHLRDPGAEDQPRLVTTGLIDPLVCHWGRSPTRLAGQRLDAPRIDVASLQAADPKLGRWVGDRLRPKLLVATQSRVVEVVVDAAGTMIPSVPVVSVEVEPERLWDAAVVLSAPPVSLWALRHHGGAALSDDTIKLSARQIQTIPLPDDRSVIPVAVAAAQRATALIEADPGEWPDDVVDLWNEAMWDLGMAMCRAYQVAQPEALTAWWHDRLPRRFTRPGNGLQKSRTKSG